MNDGCGLSCRAKVQCMRYYKCQPPCASKKVETVPSASTNIPMQAKAQIAAIADKLEKRNYYGARYHKLEIYECIRDLRQLLHW